jgi:hypothetical protein
VVVEEEAAVAMGVVEAVRCVEYSQLPFPWRFSPQSSHC